MEKLQAALARAREKRESDPRPLRRSEPGARPGSRRSARDAEIAERWASLVHFEPSADRLEKSRIFADRASNDSQHFDILRTKLLLEMRRNDWKRIAITSPTPGCGKTTTSCNLIAGLGRQPELRGILFDFDLRRPSVSHLFGSKPEHSLEDVLKRKVDFPENAMRLHDNTCVAMTSKAVPDPAQVVLSNQTVEVIDAIQRDYQPDIMLFDTPPVMMSDETRGFLKNVDAVLIVAAAETTSVAQVDQVEREVAQYTNVVGIVLNKCRFMEENYGYSY